MPSNYLALIVAALGSFVVGWAWYSPMLFGKMFMKESGMSEADMKKGKEKGMTKGLMIEFVGTLIMVYVLAMLMGMLKVMDMNGAWMLAFWLWFGFKLPSSLSSMAWMGKSWKTVMIELHGLVGMGVAGSILLAMK